MKICRGSGSLSHSRILVAKPVCSRSMSPGSTTTPSAAMISWSVARSTPRQSWPRWWAQVDEHAAALHAVEGHVLEAEVVGEGAVAAAVARGVVARADEVDAGAVAVVVDGLLDPVAVGVELGADVGEGVPLGRVLQREGDHVVGPDVDVLGVAEVGHLAHVDVVEGVGDALHVLGRARRAGGGRRWFRAVPPGKSRGRLRQKRDRRPRPRARPARTFSGVSRLMRPSSSSSPQSPQVEPSGRCVHRFVTAVHPTRPHIACTDRLV